jgi:ABC-type Fe3+ transport system substrate-binding protein
MPSIPDCRPRGSLAPRLLRLGLGLALLASVACGSGSSSNRSPSTGSSSPNLQAGAPPEWQQAVDAAKKEKVVVVATPGEAYEQFIDAFKKAYPDIPVDFDEERPDQFAPKALTEQKNNLYNFDVWIGRTSNMNGIVLPAGGFQDITPFLILNSVKDPKNWKGGKLLFTSDKGNYVLENNLVLGPSIWVNRDVVPKSQFSNPDQLLDPALKGKISYRTPTAPHGGSLFLTGVIHAKGPDAVQKLLTQQGLIFQDNAQLLATSLIQGKTGIEIGGDEPTITKCWAEGGCKNIEEVYQKYWAIPDGIGVMKDAPHPNATKVFVNWYLSKDGQQAFADIFGKLHQSGANSLRVDVEPRDPEHLADSSKLDQYTVQGTDAGDPLMAQVLKMYKDLSSK